MPLTGVPFIGDSLRDLEAGLAAGAEPILVLTGNGEKSLAQLPTHLASVRVYRDLWHAAVVMLDGDGQGAPGAPGP